MKLDRMLTAWMLLLLMSLMGRLALCGPVVKRDAHAAGSCRDPSAHRLRTMLLGNMSSASFEPDFSTSDGNYSTLGDGSCAEMSPVTTVQAINVRATCPWGYAAEERSDRYPRKIMRAVKQCRHCLDGEGHEIPDAYCEPVYVAAKVLKHNQDCEDGRLNYQVDYEDIPVAFTCSRVL